jgi:hypothetical protein
MTRAFRIVAMSDLHNEFEHPRGPRRATSAWFALREARRRVPGHPAVGPFLGHLSGEQIDLVVMAGDIDLDEGGIAYAGQISTFLGVPVVYVMGNHEPYRGRDLELLVPKLAETARATSGQVTFLENESVTFDIGGRRLHVLGCCLWTDYRLNGTDDLQVAEAMREAADNLSDHVLIRQGVDRFSPAMARQRHGLSRAWLAREVARIRETEGGAADIIIVTHHAPIPGANPPQFRDGKLAPAFASDLRTEILDWQPTAWIWGHTHYSMQAQVGRTRLISAQRGYICDEPGADEFRPAVFEL